jgi:hypothetical protein
MQQFGGVWRGSGQSLCSTPHLLGVGLTFYRFVRQFGCVAPPVIGGVTDGQSDQRSTKFYGFEITQTVTVFRRQPSKSSRCRCGLACRGCDHPFLVNEELHAEAPVDLDE